MLVPVGVKHGALEQTGRTARESKRSRLRARRHARMVTRMYTTYKSDKHYSNYMVEAYMTGEGWRKDLGVGTKITRKVKKKECAGNYTCRGCGAGFIC